MKALSSFEDSYRYPPSASPERASVLVTQRKLNLCVSAKVQPIKNNRNDFGKINLSLGLSITRLIFRSLRNRLQLRIFTQTLLFLLQDGFIFTSSNKPLSFHKYESVITMLCYGSATFALLALSGVAA